MASDKASQQDPHGSLEAAPGGPELRHPEKPAADPAAVSDDLNRIADYLTERRSASSARAEGLAAELTHRREEIASRASASTDFAERLSEIADEIPKQALVKRQPAAPFDPNPLLAERLHAFCCEMDDLLDSFRSRIEHSKQVKH